ncbi:MAG: tetratricopeptide repeat protein [Bryobacteraceae bacterium]
MTGLLTKLGFKRKIESPGRLRKRLTKAARTVDYKPQQVAAFSDSVESLREQISNADQRGFSAAKRAALRIELATLLRKLAVTTGRSDSDSKLNAAEESAREAIALAAEVTDVAAYVLALDALSEIFAARENWAAVEKTTQEAARLAPTSPRPDPLQAAHRVHLLGTAKYFTGHPEEALEALDRALLMHEETYGPDHLRTSDVLLEIGKVFRSQGEHEAAQEYLHRAYLIRRSHLGEATPEVVEVVQHFAMSMHESGDVDGAIEQFERLLVLKELQLGVQNIEQLAEIQYSMATYYQEWGRVSRARELVITAVGTFRPKGGVRLAVCHEMLGQLEETRGQYRGAIEELELAAKVWTSLGQNRAAELVRNLQYRADLLEEMGRHQEAWMLHAKATEIQNGEVDPLPTSAGAVDGSFEKTRRKLL